MSKTIDERVVSMKFDNEQFKKATQATISTLDKLKKSLNMENAVKSFEKVDSAAKKVDMAGLGEAVEGVRVKFSALQVIAVTALTNITNSAINAGKKITSALTIDPIKTGLQEYETQIGAIQTILANTQHEGTNLQQVNKALDELNTYADQTIYNFTEMTRNIGTFTAAGVSLQTSVDSIKGIANLAAVSGSTSAQASTAMYQLSQALAAGKVSLMDWNSVVNAGMGGKVFQDALIRTSELLGTGAKAAIKANGSFRDSLTKGEWLTTEVLTETLKQFSGVYDEADLIQQGFTADQAKAIADMAETAVNAATKVKTISQLWDTLKESAQSGWTSTWEIIIGDFEEAQEFLTVISENVGNILQKSSDARNAVLSGGLSSGWKQLLDAGIGDEASYIDAIQEVARKNSDTFDKMVEDADDFTTALKKCLKDGTISSKTLTDAVHNLKEKMSGMSQEELKSAGYTSEMVKQITKLDDGLKDGSVSMDEFTDKILRPSGRENLIQAIYNVSNKLVNVVSLIKKEFRDIFPAVTAEQIYKFTENVRKLTERMKLSKEATENLKKTFRGLFSVLDIIKQVFSALITAISPLTKRIGTLGGGLLKVTGSVGGVIASFDKFIQKGNLLQRIAEKISEGFELLISACGRVRDRFKQITETSIEMKTVVVNGFVGIADELANGAFINILETILYVASVVGKGIVNIFSRIASAITTNIGKADFSILFDLINGISIGAIGLAVSKFINSITTAIESVGSFKESLIGILDSVRGCFEAYQSQLKANVLEKIAYAVAILAVSLFSLSMIDSEKLGYALGGITVLFTELMLAMNIMTKISMKSIGTAKAITSMIGMSAAILILATALKQIGDLNIGNIASGLIGIAGMTAIIIAAAKIMGKGKKKVMKGAVSMVIFAAAIKVLASACKDMSSLSWEEIARGLTGVGAIMAAVVVFLQFAKSNKKMVSTATGMVILASSLKVMASACKDFAAMDFESMARGLLGMEVVIAAICASMKLLPAEQNMIAAGVGILAISAGMLIIAVALKQIGALSNEEIGKGLYSISIAIAALVIGLRGMNEGLKGAVAMVTVSAALLLLSQALKELGKMSVGGLAISLIALAGAFAILTVAGWALTPLISTFLGLSASFAIFSLGLIGIGASLMLAGAGLTALAAGITAIAAAGTATATAFIASLTIIITGIISLIPSIAVALAEGIVSFIETLAKGISAIEDVLKAFITGIVDIAAEVLVNCAPDMAIVLLEMISNILISLDEYIPVIVDSIFSIIVNILDGVARNLPSLVQSVAEVLKSFFGSIFDAFGEVDPDSLLKVVASIGLFAGVIAALSAITSLIPGAMVGVLGMGAIIAELAIVLAAIGGLSAIPGFKWLLEQGGEILGGLGTAIGKFIGGIAGGFMSGVSSQFPQIGKDLSDFMDNVKPFIEGASSIDPNIMTGVKALAEVVLILTAADIFNKLTSWFTGGVSFSEFGNQLVPFGKAMKDFSIAVAGVDAESIQNSAIAGKALAELANTIPNSGGLVSLFTGDNDFKTWGEQLIPFGTAIKGYSLAVAGMDASVVTNSANAAMAISELSNNLPNSGGLVSLFTGDNDIGTFGKRLALFGESFAEYYTSVSGLDTAILNSTTNEFRKIVNVLNAAQNIDPDAASNFAENLKNLGASSVDGFINAFKDANSKVRTAVNEMLKACTDSANSQQEKISTEFNALINVIIVAFTDKYDKFRTIGLTLITNLIAGVSNKETLLKRSFKQLVSACITTIRDKRTDFKNTGQYLVEGFAEGIDKYTWYAEAKSRLMAKAAIEAVKAELAIASPSKVTYRIGEYFGMGFINGINDYADKSYSASKDMASYARNGLKDTIGKIGELVSEGIDTQPTISPILDLSQVKNSAGKLSALLSSDHAMKINAGIVGSSNSTIKDNDVTNSKGNNYSFVQNNYSPKALSRIDIYRQTKNQISVLKGLN